MGFSAGVSGVVGAGTGLIIGATVIESVGNMMLKAAKEEGKMLKKRKKNFIIK